MQEYPEYCTCRTLVLGLGNDLKGDDGFGRAVARRLAASELPGDVCVLDAGTSVRQVLFDVVLSPVRPARVVVVDAVDLGLAPGELLDLRPSQFPPAKLDDFCLHQLPTSNLLRELEELAGVEVLCLVCQVDDVPEGVRPGLSPAVRQALEPALKKLRRLVAAPATAARAGETRA